MLKPEVVVNTRPILGECPVWDENTGILYFVDILGRRIFRLHPGLNAVESVDTGEDTGFCVLTQNGRLVAGLESGFYYFDFLTGKKDLIVSAPTCSAGYRFNDGKCDAAGRLWAGTLASAWTGGGGNPSMMGYLHCLDQRLHLTLKAGNIILPNGIGFSPDHRHFYFADSFTRVVTAYDFNIDTGSITSPRPAVTVPQGAGMPDGLTVDDEGMLWVCHYGGAMVGRYDPVSAELIAKVEMPCRYVTSCAFGGRNMDELYITTATTGAYGPDASPLAGSLFCIMPGVSGARSYRFCI